jgi:UDP-2,3-diacylglucosamine hydrolase
MVIKAPPHWHRVDFVSDLHLHSGLPTTTNAFFNYLSQGVNGHRPDALFLLGDVFEVWIGDDVLDPNTSHDDPENTYLQQCARHLKLANQHTELHWMAGNRDFLLGSSAQHAMGLRGLDDPCPLELGSTRLLLSHADAGCLDDTDYQAFRQEVRSGDWQARFLAQTQAVRWSQARAIRAQSESDKQHDKLWADVDATWADEQLRQCGASILLHGHTHRPGTHDLPSDRQRWVLSDWDLDHPTQPRAEVLRWDNGEWQRHSVPSA